MYQASCVIFSNQLVLSPTVIRSCMVVLAHCECSVSLAKGNLDESTARVIDNLFTVAFRQEVDDAMVIVQAYLRSAHNPANLLQTLTAVFCEEVLIMRRKSATEENFKSM